MRITTDDGFLSYKKEQGVYSNVYQAKEFKIASIKRSNETNGDATGQFTFTVQLASDVRKNEYFKITPPSGIEIMPGGEQCSSVLPLQSVLSCTLSNESLYILILPEDPAAEVLKAGSFLTFKVRLIQNPLTLRPTESFQLFITTSISQDYNVNQILSGASIINSQPGILRNVRVAPDDISFGVVTNYSVSFSTANPTPAGSSMLITFPSSYYSHLTQISCVPIKASGALTCGVSPLKQNVLLLTNVFDKDRAAGEEVSFKLEQVQNPLKSVSQAVINSEFFITTVAPDGFAIDQTVNPDFLIGCTYPCATCDGIQTKCTSC